MLVISEQEANFSRNLALPLQQLSCFHLSSEYRSRSVELSFPHLQHLFQAASMDFHTS